MNGGRMITTPHGTLPLSETMMSRWGTLVYEIRPRASLQCTFATLVSSAYKSPVDLLVPYRMPTGTLTGQMSPQDVRTRTLKAVAEAQMMPRSQQGAVNQQIKTKNL
jgi:hypothetical protein